mgnify:CR=1 FL=1
MEENGLIFRESLPNDGRMKKIVVTEKALQYKDIVMSDITQLEDELTTDISESDMDIFFKVVEKCSTIFLKVITLPFKVAILYNKYLVN